MLVFIFIVLAAILTVGIAIAIVFVQARRVFREQKNYERGLKMVPLLIHLPPQSDDIEGGNRDDRDVIDENISKAQILYDIIGSTLKKSNLKSRFYGQKHLAFEIIGSKGLVHYYAAVPISLVDVVQQAIISAYPAARLEEVPEHNIFSPTGKASGTVGGELTLKEHYGYPIATYQDLKRDAMQSILNALSSLDKEEGAGVQILIRPAGPEWRKNASAKAQTKRKGKDSKKGTAKYFGIASQMLQAFWKPPEAKKNDSPKPELSNMDQAISDAIDDKTRYTGFEVLIRIIASSKSVQRSQTLLKNLEATFALFNAPGKNGFKFTPAKDIESFSTAFILRFFPQENNQSILNAVELASLFHFPDQKNIPTTQLERQASKQVDGPRNISEEGLLLGYNVFRGVNKAIRVAKEDRQRHMYLVGQTGTGKSTLMENLALQDMLNGEGFAFIDPHGDAVERLMGMVPRERTEDVIYFCPADMDFPMGLNMFEFSLPEQKDFLIQEAINMLYKLYDPLHQGIIGPRYENWFRNAALTLMADPEGATFIDIPKVFIDNKYAKQKLKHVTDHTVLDFWNKEMAQTSDYHKSEVLGWFVSKFGAFLSNEMMRNIIGQTKSSFNLREIMDEGKILFVNLSKGRTGDLNSKLLGMIFVMKFQAAAMSRANIPINERKDFCLYVDEFQNYSTESFATIMSEARKYHLNLIVANQFTTQLTEEVRDAVFGNIGTIVAFRIGQNDVEALRRYFQPLFNDDDLLRIPNANAIVRTLVGGVPTQSFSMSTLPPLGEPKPALFDAIKQLSAAKYGRPKSKVEKEIYERLKTIEEPRPTFSGGGQFGPAAANLPPGAAPGSQSRPPTTGSSFLDDWLAKRSQPGPPQPGMPPPGFPGANPPVAGPNPLPAPPLAASTTPVSPPVSATNLPAANQPIANQEVALNINRPPAGNAAPANPAAPAPEPKPAIPADDSIAIDPDGTLHVR